ncbi:MAG: hypothetical protein JW894_13595 [Bacteroidales bacterium]|nr:hypothetical protein [Bacteroidales bacterium]
MKEKSKKSDVKVDLKDLFLKDQILSEHAMQSVRGGDGDGGGDIILYPPPKP